MDVKKIVCDNAYPKNKCMCPKWFYGLFLICGLKKWLGLAIHRLACPDLAVDQSPNARTYKSHRYTSQVKKT